MKKLLAQKERNAYRLLYILFAVSALHLFDEFIFSHFGVSVKQFDFILHLFYLVVLLLLFYFFIKVFKDKKETTDKLYEMKFYDMVTGVPNYSAFQNYFEQNIKSMQKTTDENIYLFLNLKKL